MGNIHILRRNPDNLFCTVGQLVKNRIKLGANIGTGEVCRSQFGHSNKLATGKAERESAKDVPQEAPDSVADNSVANFSGNCKADSLGASRLIKAKQQKVPCMIFSPGSINRQKIPAPAHAPGRGKGLKTHLGRH